MNQTIRRFILIWLALAGLMTIMVITSCAESRAHKMFKKLLLCMFCRHDLVVNDYFRLLLLIQHFCIQATVGRNINRNPNICMQALERIQDIQVMVLKTFLFEVCLFSSKLQLYVEYFLVITVKKLRRFISGYRRRIVVSLRLLESIFIISSLVMRKQLR